MALESHPPHKIIDLSFSITNSNNKLIFWGGG